MSGPARTPGSTARILALASACVLWGLAFAVAKTALRVVPVPHVILGRFLVACAVLVPVAARRAGLPRRGDLPLVLVTGLVGVPGIFLVQYAGLVRTTVTSASLIVGAAPAILAVGAALFQGERPGVRGWSAIGLSSVGVAALVGVPGPGHAFEGDLLVLVSMFTSAAWMLLSVRLIRRRGVLFATTWPLLFGTLATAPIAWAWAGPPPVDAPASAVASVVVLGVVCTAGTFALWNWGLAGVESSRAGVFLNLEPVVGAAAGILLFGDPTGPTLGLGGGLVLASAVWMSLPVAPRGARDTHSGRVRVPIEGAPCRDHA